MKSKKRTKEVAYALAVLLAFGNLLSFAWSKPRPTRATPAAHQAFSHPKAVEEFFDDFFARAMPRWHIPGAAVVLVKNGKVVFIKGYGYAKLVDRVPVVADRTVFRVASVSKVFTATAGLQLVESGKLRLHANVNQYLTCFKVHDPYPQPVTLAELLTHSAGLDASVIGIAAHGPSQVVPLGTFLARRLPRVVMPPGKIYSYSSFGITLEGYLVQKMSGEPFDVYMERHVLQPLGMLDSSFRLTPALAANLATGYEYKHGRYTAQPVDYFNIFPAAGLYSTVSDMAHFLIVQMDGGVYEGKRILTDAAVREMRSRQFTEDPRLAGRTFGFYERFVNGHRAIGHGGNIRGFGSLLMMVPKEHVGFFLVFNRDESRFEDDFIHSFFNRFCPEKPQGQTHARLRLRAAELRKFTGAYRTNPYSRHTFEKLITLYWQFHITANPDGTLEFHYPHHFKPSGRWVAVGPNYFLCSGGQGHAVFKTGPAGRVTRLFTDRNSYERVPWYGTQLFHVALVMLLMLILLSGCVWWPVHALIRRWRKRPGDPAGLRGARWTAAVLALLNVFFIVEMFHLLNRMDDWDFVYGVPPAIRALLWIPIATTTLTAAVVCFAAWAWKKRAWSAWGRVHYSLITASALLFIWFFVYWNLLGFRY